MPRFTKTLETATERAIRDFVLTEATLAIYDPMQTRRAAVPVVSFDIELLEFDAETSIAHAAGPVVLRGEDCEVEQYLRISVPVKLIGKTCSIPKTPSVRAAYIVVTDESIGACKETLALANA